jgi:hypothetical protein
LDGQSGDFLYNGLNKETGIPEYIAKDRSGPADGNLSELVVTGPNLPARPFGMMMSDINRSPTRFASSQRAAAGLPNYAQQFAQDYDSTRNAGSSQIQLGFDQLNRYDYASGDGVSANLNTASGLLNIFGGGVAFMASPLTGAVNTIVGRPLEALTGGVLPREFAGNTTLTIGSFFVGGAAGARAGVSEAAATESGALVSNVRAISAADVNAPFLAKDWDAPYSYGSQARGFTTASDLKFVRVTTDNPQGAFLVRPGEIAGMTPEQVQVHLALPKVPTNILDVSVPAGTRMQTGFVGPQPSFGVTTRGGVQYQLLDQIPSQNFGPMRPLR